MATIQTALLPGPATGRTPTPPRDGQTRSPWVDRFNDLLERAWSRGWAQRPTLDPEAIVTAAQYDLGRIDFPGRRDWFARLEDLTAALNGEARLNPLGLACAHGQLVRTARQRLGLELLWRRHPEIAERPIAPPIVVLGQMRSGTTRMQRMLASDPRLTATRFYESWNPLPPRWLDLRSVNAWAALRFNRLLNPDLLVRHPTAALAADEEAGWLALGLSATPFDAQWNIPSFIAADQGRDPLPTYRLFKRVLQTQHWQSGTGAEAHVLKVPQFMEDVDALSAIFPAARFIHVTRDPAAVVGSSCALVESQRSVQSDSVDPIAIGREWLARTVRRESVARAWLERGAAPTIRVDYSEMDRRWRYVMQCIYRMLRAPLPENVLARMEQAHRRPEAPGSGYSLARYGLDSETVRAALNG